MTGDEDKRRYRDERWLAEQYEKHAEDDNTSAAIAEKCGVDQTTIRRWAARHDLYEPDRRTSAIYHTQDSRGYPTIFVRESGRAHCIRVHRLIAVAEHGYDAVVEGEVHHKNGVRWHNTPDNLSVLSSKEHSQAHVEVADEEFVKEVAANQPTTSAEVAELLDANVKTVRSRLRNLCESGRLSREKDHPSYIYTIPDATVDTGEPIATDGGERVEDATRDVSPCPGCGSLTADDTCGRDRCEGADEIDETPL